MEDRLGSIFLTGEAVEVLLLVSLSRLGEQSGCRIITHHVACVFVMTRTSVDWTVSTRRLRFKGATS